MSSGRSFYDWTSRGYDPATLGEIASAQSLATRSVVYQLRGKTVRALLFPSLLRLCSLLSDISYPAALVIRLLKPAPATLASTGVDLNIFNGDPGDPIIRRGWICLDVGFWACFIGPGGDIGVRQEGSGAVLDIPPPFLQIPPFPGSCELLLSLSLVVGRREFLVDAARIDLVANHTSPIACMLRVPVIPVYTPAIQDSVVFGLNLFSREVFQVSPSISGRLLGPTDLPLAVEPGAKCEIDYLDSLPSPLAVAGVEDEFSGPIAPPHLLAGMASCYVASRGAGVGPLQEEGEDQVLYVRVSTTTLLDCIRSILSRSLAFRRSTRQGSSQCPRPPEQLPASADDLDLMMLSQGEHHFVFHVTTRTGMPFSFSVTFCTATVKSFSTSAGHAFRVDPSPIAPSDRLLTTTPLRRAAKMNLLSPGVYLIERRGRTAAKLEDQQRGADPSYSSDLIVYRVTEAESVSLRLRLTITQQDMQAGVKVLRLGKVVLRPADCVSDTPSILQVTSLTHQMRDEIRRRSGGRKSSRDIEEYTAFRVGFIWKWGYETIVRIYYTKSSPATCYMFHLVFR